MGKLSTSQFSIKDLQDLSLWLKADAGITLDGSNVILWKDQSGNGLDVQADYSSQDISFISSASDFNNKPVVRFSTNYDNGDVGLSNSNPFDGKTCFIVYKLNSTDNFEYSVPYENTLINIYTSYDNGNRIFGGYYNGFYDSNTVSTIGVPYLRTILTEDGVNINYFINGVTDGNPTGQGSYTRNYIVIGNGGARNAGPDPSVNQPFQGDLAEIIVYSRVLTETERLKVEAYLNRKYEIYSPITKNIISIKKQNTGNGKITLKKN